MDAQSSNNFYMLLNNGDSGQPAIEVEPNGRTHFKRTRRFIRKQVNKWMIKEIIVGLIMVCLAVAVIVLANRPNTMINNCKQNMPMTESKISPMSTTTSTELLTNYFHQEMHFNILPNTMALICKKSHNHINDSICLNLPVFDTNSNKMIEMKIMKNVEDSFEMFHPFDYIPFSIGEYSVQFKMSIFRHVKHPTTFGVSMKLDEKILVSCLKGQLGDLSVHETEPCSFLPAPDRKYSVDLDKEHTFVWSLISFNLDVKVENDDAKLKLVFAQEGFIDDATLVIAKKS